MTAGTGPGRAVGAGCFVAAVALVALVALGGCDRLAGWAAAPAIDDRATREAPRDGAERATHADEPSEDPPSEPDPVDPARAFSDAMLAEARSKDYAGRPELLARVRGSAYGFFRSVNHAFADCVCKVYGASVRGSPPVNLHGDAHLENYAVTNDGRGLTDFDDATLGPAVIDLARLATSVRLALRQRGWSDRAGEAEARLWSGYRDGLNRPDDIPPDPPYATRVRRATERPRGEALDAFERLMSPLDERRRELVLTGIREYGAERRAADPSIPAHYFDVQKLGKLEIGIGSALDEKYLFRIQGPSAAPEDDEVLEAKEVRSLAGISCVHSGQDQDPLRIVLAAERLAYQPYPLAGFYFGHERSYWIHAWHTSYTELAVGEGRPGSLASVEELGAVLYDIGFQLGRGHPRQVGAPIEEEVRPYLVRSAEAEAEAVSSRSEVLLDAVVDAWRRFRDEVPAPTGRGD